MKRNHTRLTAFFILFFLILMCLTATAQKPSYSAQRGANPILWEPVNVRAQDLFLGPGGQEMLPDLSQITLLKEETGGHSKKYRIKDGAGRTWVAKLGDEA